MAARPYTITQWTALTPAQKKGFKNYQAYQSWWNRAVKPRFAPKPAAQDPFPGFLTPEEQRAEAVKVVEAELGPARTELERQRKQAAADALAQQEANRISTEAYARGLEGLAPHIQGIYRQAAGDQAALGAGYSSGMRQLQEQAAAQTNAQLSFIGAPEGQMSRPGTGASDVLYGTGGVIPAETMGREGAAWTAHAASMPAFALGEGAQFARSIAAQAAQENKSFSEKLLELEQQRPGLIDKAIDSLRSSQSSSRSNWISEQYLMNTLRQTGASITGTDPVTGQPTYTNREAQQDDAAKLAKERRDAAVAARQNRAAAVSAKGTARRDTRTGLFADAKSLIETVETHDPSDKYGTGKIKAKKYPPYAQARKALFNKYKDYLRYASGAGRAQLQRELYQMVDEALAAAGFRRTGSSSILSNVGGAKPG